MVGWSTWWIEWVMSSHSDASTWAFKMIMFVFMCPFPLCVFQVWRAGRIHSHPGEAQHWRNWDCCKCNRPDFHLFLPSYRRPDLSLEWWNSSFPSDGCRQPIQAKGHHLGPHHSQLHGAWAFLSFTPLTCTQTCSLTPKPPCPTAWWFKCSVVLCVLRHPCTDAPFWEPGRNHCRARPVILTHMQSHSPYQLAY